MPGTGIRALGGQRLLEEWLGLFVPAMPSLYGSLDYKSGHYRRYDERTATELGDQASLLCQRWQGDLRRLRDEAARDGGRIESLLTGLPGIASLLWRDTAAMGPLLALHLGVVFSLFITMPYGKFVHGIYRYVALVRYARERRMMLGHKV